MRLKGKSAIITGGTSGIGRASAELFAREGAYVLVSGVEDDEGLALVEQLRRQGGVAEYLRADVARPEDNQRLVSLCLDHYGRLDILFCNAGRFLGAPIEITSDADLDMLLSVNLKSLVYATRAAIPVMLRQGGGAILFNASKTGLVAQTGSPLYCATKGAAVLLAKALALDYARQNIRVNALCPGIIATPMLEAAALSMPDPAAAMAEWRAAQPIGRLGTPEECAEAALWLVSDQARFITGVALPVDGGFTAM